MIVLAEKTRVKFSSVIGQFRSVYCYQVGLFEVRVLLDKLSRSVGSLFRLCRG